jgi:VIT1/CCC1 family predicted Fe2+/Mn2+ transporter
MMARDALGAHARDELGIFETNVARPVQAALTSAATFAAGAALPLVMAVVTPAPYLLAGVSVASLGFLAALGAIGARLGGAPVGRAAFRVTFWGGPAIPVS